MTNPQQTSGEAAQTVINNASGNIAGLVEDLRRDYDGNIPAEVRMQVIRLQTELAQAVATLEVGYQLRHLSKLSLLDNVARAIGTIRAR